MDLVKYCVYKTPVANISDLKIRICVYVPSDAHIESVQGFSET